MVTFERIVAPEPIEAPFFTSVGSTFQSLLGLKFAAGRRRARIRVVDERHAMADEDVIFDRDALTDERVARNLAAAADPGVLLDFDERADLRLVADLAAVEIDKSRASSRRGRA